MQNQDVKAMVYRTRRDDMLARMRAMAEELERAAAQIREVADRLERGQPIPGETPLTRHTAAAQEVARLVTWAVPDGDLDALLGHAAMIDIDLAAGELTLPEQN